MDLNGLLASDDLDMGVHDRFMLYDAVFFNNVLAGSGVSVDWSKRMTSCAGLCHSDGRISLSEPLLKLRPLSDLIDTLLHEMIHAYIFMTKNNKDRDDHGPTFQEHMNRINQSAGTTITIYHSFHDEVKHYQTHVWQCDGPCKLNQKHQGIVRRAMNRPPQPADWWFAKHLAECGGTFHKISEPPPKESPKRRPTAEPSGAKKRKSEIEADALHSQKKISDFFKQQPATDDTLAAECPVCNHRVPLDKLEEHVNLCLDDGNEAARPEAPTVTAFPGRASGPPGFTFEESSEFSAGLGSIFH